MSKRPLSALRIGNFKAFGDTQRIPIKPITLIFGPNSAGKSSIIHSLALAHEVHVREQYAWGAMLDVHRTDIGGSAIDLGGFRQFVHRSQVEKRVEWGLEISREAFDEDFKDHVQGDTFLVSVTFGIANADEPVAKGQSSSPAVESLEVSLDGEELIRLSRRETSDEGIVYFRVDRFSTHHTIFQQKLDFLEERLEQMGHRSLGPDSRSILNEFIDQSLPYVDAPATGLLGFRIEFSPIKFWKSQVASRLLGQKEVWFQNALNAALELFWEGCEEFFSSVHSAVTSNISRFNYLGPIRELPPRNFTIGSQKDVDWRASGRYAWDVITRDENVREVVNLWLGNSKLKTPYKLRVTELVALDDLDTYLSDALYHIYDRRNSFLATRANLEGELEQVKEQLAKHNALEEEYLEQALGLLEPWRERLASVAAEQREALIQEALFDIEAKQANLISETPFEYTDQDALDDFNVEIALEDQALTRAAELVAHLHRSSIGKQLKLVLHDLKRRTDVSHRDVGIGISQVLPVLVSAYGSERMLIAMEQPEIHLHPALQAELGDVFIESAMGDRQNTFLLETHSEHLILRIMRRIRESHMGEDTGLPPISSKDVSVLYVEPVDSRSIVREIPLNELGELAKAWPGGFFEEALREQFGDA